MADSVALLRRKVEDTSLAVQDGTMNSVITLATIEVSLFLAPLCQLPLTPLQVWQGQYRDCRNAR
jgi:hypothetical protein